VGTGGERRFRRSVYLPKLLFEALTYTGRVQNLDRIMPEETEHARRKVAVRKRGQTPSAETFEDVEGDVEDREGEIKRVQQIIGIYRLRLLKSGRLKEFAEIFEKENRELNLREEKALGAKIDQHIENVKTGWTTQLEDVARDIKTINSIDKRRALRRKTEELFNATTFHVLEEKKHYYSNILYNLSQAEQEECPYEPWAQECTGYFHQLIKRRTVNKRVLFERLQSAEKWAFVCTPFTKRELTELSRITKDFEIAIDVLKLDDGGVRLLITRGDSKSAAHELSINPEVCSSYGHTHKITREFFHEVRGAEPSDEDDDIAKEAYERSGNRFQEFVLASSKEFQMHLSVYKGEWCHYYGVDAILELQEIGVVKPDTPALHTVSDEKRQIKRAHETAIETEDSMQAAHTMDTDEPYVVVVDTDAVPYGQTTKVKSELISIRKRYKEKYGRKVVILQCSLSDTDLYGLLDSKGIILRDRKRHLAVVAAESNWGDLLGLVDDENLTLITDVKKGEFIHIEPIVSFAFTRLRFNSGGMDPNFIAKLHSLYTVIVDRDFALTEQEFEEIISNKNMLRLIPRRARTFDREELHDLHKHAKHLAGQA